MSGPQSDGQIRFSGVKNLVALDTHKEKQAMNYS
jgi:hypothetical protein